MKRDVIIACDFASGREVFDFLSPFEAAGSRPFVKIGMELFYAAGPSVVRELKSRGYRIFLDLKLHDIPNTVRKSMRVLSSLDVDMVNLHAAGGSLMMKAALEGLVREDGSRPLLIAVTQLTSTSQQILEDELLIKAPMQEVISSYARNACSSGLDGVVCSPLEAAAVKQCCADSFICVTPGIRFPESAADDQVRVMTPLRARAAGSDFIVVGRPITSASDPIEAYNRCINEFVYGKENC